MITGTAMRSVIGSIMEFNMRLNMRPVMGLIMWMVMGSVMGMVILSISSCQVSSIAWSSQILNDPPLH